MFNFTGLWKILCQVPSLLGEQGITFKTDYKKLRGLVQSSDAAVLTSNHESYQRFSGSGMIPPV